jgi:hypothetical protein
VSAIVTIWYGPSDGTGVGEGPRGLGAASLGLGDDGAPLGRMRKTGLALARDDGEGSGGGDGTGVPVEDGVGGMSRPGFGGTGGTGIGVGVALETAEGVALGAGEPDGSVAGEAEVAGAGEAEGELEGACATHFARIRAASRGSVFGLPSSAQAGPKTEICTAASASVARTARTRPAAPLSARRAGT